jgi:hypothetical protein
MRIRPKCSLVRNLLANLERTSFKGLSLIGPILRLGVLEEGTARGGMTLKRVESKGRVCYMVIAL